MIRITTSITRWWDKAKQGLILGLIPLLLACENDSFLSLPTNPGQPDLKLLFTRIPVPFSVVQLDSVRTSPVDENSRSLAGRIQDADLGSVSVSTFIKFGVASPRPAVEANARYDSMALRTIYTRSYGPADNSILALQVQRLAQPFKDSTIYYSDDLLPVEAPVLSTVRLMSKVTGPADTLTFRIDDALGQDFFQRAQGSDDSMISDSELQEFFNGLALTPTEDSRSVGSFDARGIRLIMYFTDADNDAQTYEFSVSNYFNNIRGDRAGTALMVLTAPDQEIIPADGRFYLQSGAAITPKLDLGAALDSIRGYSADTTQQALLNRVELSIGLADIRDTLNAPPSIAAYSFEPESYRRIPQRDQSGRFIGYQGAVSDQTRQGVADEMTLNANGQYQLPVTNFINVLLANESASPELIVLGSNFDQSVNQIVTLPDSVYLNIYYSLLAP